jgi:hypothetical protein
VLLALLVGLVVAGPAPAEASPSTGAMVFDAMVLRPLGFASTVVGVVLWVPVALISLPYGADGREEAYGIFIEAPVRRTFKRPLGDF